MAKALKAVAIVAGVAALAVVTGGAALGLGVALSTTALGVSAGTLLLVSSVAGTAGQLLTKGPKVPASQTDRLTASIDPRAFRKTVFGQTAFPVDVRYEEWSGADQEYCDWIVALASHAIDGIEEIWLNTEMAWSQTTGVTPKYRGYFSVPNLILEGSPANAFSFASGRWNGSARLTGCAYARLRFKVTGNGKKAESPFVGGIPNRITIIGRGAKLYDPRRDSTVPGGAGPMRAGDQSTWRYTADDGATIGENLPLQILRVVLGWRIRNPVTGEMKLATGSGVPAKRLALASWIMAANLADEQVNRSAGGTEPRYHGAGVVSEGDEPKTALDAMCAACCARFRDTSGKLSIAIAHNDLANAATDDGLGNDDVVGGFTWDPDPSLAATPNVIRGRYVDASTNSLYQLIDYPEVRLASPDGQDRIFPLDLAVVESASQAQRIAKQVLQRKQYQREFTAPFDIRAWKYTVGDLVPFTFAPLSFNRALFRVKEQELGQGGTCNMTLSVENAQIYAFDRDDAAPVLAAEAIVYDASRNPLVLAIADAGTTADWEGVTGVAKPADNATDSRDPDSPFGPDGTVGEMLATLDKIEPITLDVSALKEAKVGTDAALAALDDAVVDQAAAQRQIERHAGRLDEALLRTLVEANRTRAVLRDAGIVVDPVTGIVRIYAIDQLADRTSRAEVTLDAQKAQITSKASVDQVQELIARAVLDPSQVAELEPLIRRLSSAEIAIDGLDAAVRTKAELVELTRLGGRVTTAEQAIDAAEGLIAAKVEQTDFDLAMVRLGSAEQSLRSYGDISNFSVTLRQARAATDAGADATLRAILGADVADRRRIVAQSEVRQELYAKITDDVAAEARSRLVLAVAVGALDARSVQDRAVLIEADKALARDIDALAVTSGDQAAAIATLQEATIGADGGFAGIRTTIRQIVGRADTSDEALLRSLIAGDVAGQARRDQLVQIQTEMSTQLVANEIASAVARQALLVRMLGNEAAIVDVARVAAEADRVTAERLAALEVAFGDDVTGLKATGAALAAEVKLSAERDEARGEEIELLTATINDPATGLAQAHAAIGEANTAIADLDEATARSLEQVGASVGKVSGRVDDLREVVVGPDGVETRAVVRLDANGRVSGTVQTNDGSVASFGVVADRFGVYHPDTGALLFYVDTDGAIAASFKASSIGADNLKDGSSQGSVHFTTTSDMVIPRGYTGQLITMTFDKVEAASDMELLFYAHFVAEDDIQFDCRFIIDGVSRHTEPANLILVDSNAELTITPFRFFRGLSAGQHTISIEIYNREADNRRLTVTAGATLKCTELRRASVGSGVGSMGQVIAGPGTGGGGTGGGGGGGGGGGVTPVQQN